MLLYESVAIDFPVRNLVEIAMRLMKNTVVIRVEVLNVIFLIQWGSIESVGDILVDFNWDSSDFRR